MFLFLTYGEIVWKLAMVNEHSSNYPLSKSDGDKC